MARLALALLLWCGLMVFQSATGPRDGTVVAYELEARVETGVGALVSVPVAAAGRGLAVLLLVAPLALVAAQFRTVLDRRVGLAFCLAIGLITALELPQLSNDLFLYRTTGSLVADGENPYLVAPAAHFDRGELRGVPWTGQESPYGPLAVAVFGGLAGSGGSTVLEFWVFRVVMAVPWLVMLLVAWRFIGSSFWMIGASPLLLLEVVQGGHLDGWVGLALVAAVFLAGLDQPGMGSRVLLGVACVVALGLKLSAVVAFGALGMALVLSPTWGLRRTLLLGLAVFAGYVALWLPWWTGPEVLDGLRAESEKVLQSVYMMLGLTGSTAGNLAALMNLGALVLGAWLVRRGWPVAAAMIVALLLHAVLGRTFLQPWYFVAPLMLAAVAVGPRRGRLAGVLTHPVFWGVASVGLVFGGYALVFATRSVSPAVQALNVLLMLLPGMAALAWVSRRA